MTQPLRHLRPDSPRSSTQRLQRPKQRIRIKPRDTPNSLTKSQSSNVLHRHYSRRVEHNLSDAGPAVLTELAEVVRLVDAEYPSHLLAVTDLR